MIGFNSNMGYFAATGSLIMWYDASDGSTVQKSSGNVIGFGDKSGNGNSLVPIDVASRPVYLNNTWNSLNSIQFADGKQLYKNSGVTGISLGSNPFTVYMVVRNISDNPSDVRDTIFGFRGNNDRWAWETLNGNHHFTRNVHNDSGEAFTLSAILLKFVFDGTDDIMYLNGVEILRTSSETDKVFSDPITRIFLNCLDGVDGNSNMEFGEARLYDFDTVANGSDVTISTELTSKWGI